MKKQQFIRIFLVFSLALIIFGLTGCLKKTTVTLFGEIGDPEGDSTGTPDFLSASVSASNGEAKLSARFVPGTFNQHTTYVTFTLDTDQNPNTGHPGQDAAGTIDDGVIGCEFLVCMGGDSLGSNVKVYVYAGTLNTFDLVDTIPTTSYLDDGLDAIVPMSKLGDDDGLLNFKATCQTEVGSGGYSGIQDYITNEDLPPGTTSEI